MNNELNAAQQPVAWQRKYLGATRDGRPVDWHNITMEEFEQTKQGKWASKYEVRELYATPVAAAPTAPLKVFSNGQWIFRETGQEFRGADLDEAAFAEYRQFSTPQRRGSTFATRSCNCARTRSTWKTLAIRSMPTTACCA